MTVYLVGTKGEEEIRRRVRGAHSTEVRTAGSRIIGRPRGSERAGGDRTVCFTTTRDNQLAGAVVRPVTDRKAKERTALPERALGFFNPPGTGAVGRASAVEVDTLTTSTVETLMMHVFFCLRTSKLCAYLLAKETAIDGVKYHGFEPTQLRKNNDKQNLLTRTFFVLLLYFIHCFLLVQTFGYRVISGYFYLI